MKFLFLLFVLVFVECASSYQKIPGSFDILSQRFQQKQHLPQLNDFLYRQLLNNNNDESAEEEEGQDDTDPFAGRFGYNSEEFNDLNNSIQHDDAEGDDDSQDDDEDDGTSTEISADVRQEETESHSSLGAGHQYVSGGAGEGKQHLQPDGSVPNKDEVKTDADLPAYCDPPNPCPHGYKGADCDASRHFSEYTAEFSKAYQEQQFCMCDDDHNECQQKASAPRAKQQQIDQLLQNIKSTGSSSNNKENISPVVAKKSPRIRRDVSKSRARNHMGLRLANRVAKKKTA